MLSQQNTLRQGNVGLGVAISWFTMKGLIVSIPLNDIQDYDLIVDFGECDVKTIQVKTTRFKERGKYRVELKNSTKSFQDNKSDYLFIVDGDGVKYLIPKSIITTKKSVSLGEQYSQYIV